MSAAVTPWFDGDVKPVHVGVYERQMPRYQTAFWHWSGQQWDFGGSDAPSPLRNNYGAANQQDLPWRGLASNPAAEIGKVMP